MVNKLWSLNYILQSYKSYTTNNLINQDSERLEKLFLDPVILYQTKKFHFQDRKFMFKHKLSIP